MIKCAFLTYHASVSWDGRRQVLMLGSSLMLCSTRVWGMSDRRLHPPVLQPVSIIVLHRSFTAFSHSLLPLKADAQAQGLSLALCCGLFPCPSLSVLLLPVVFPYLVFLFFFLLSQSLVFHHQSWISLKSGAVQPPSPSLTPLGLSLSRKEITPSSGGLEISMGDISFSLFLFSETQQFTLERKSVGKTL